MCSCRKGTLDQSIDFAFTTASYHKDFGILDTTPQRLLATGMPHHADVYVMLDTEPNS